MFGIDTVMSPFVIFVLLLLFVALPALLIVLGVKKLTKQSKGRVALIAIGTLWLLFIPLVLLYTFVLVPYLHFPYPNHDYVPEEQSEIVNSDTTQTMVCRFGQDCVYVDEFGNETPAISDDFVGESTVDSDWILGEWQNWAASSFYDEELGGVFTLNSDGTGILNPVIPDYPIFIEWTLNADNSVLTINVPSQDRKEPIVRGVKRYGEQLHLYQGDYGVAVYQRDGMAFLD